MALCVDARVGVSKIHGLGLIAHDDIPAGTVVWRFNKILDIQLSLDQIEQLPLPARKQFNNYAFISRSKHLYILCGDDARFMNHSQNPNCISREGDFEACSVAAKDIKQGEELTEDYYVFDLDANAKLTGGL